MIQQTFATALSHGKTCPTDAGAARVWGHTLGSRGNRGSGEEERTSLYFGTNISVHKHRLDALVDAVVIWHTGPCGRPVSAQAESDTSNDARGRFLLFRALANVVGPLRPRSWWCLGRQRYSTWSTCAAGGTQSDHWEQAYQSSPAADRSESLTGGPDTRAHGGPQLVWKVQVVRNVLRGIRAALCCIVGGCTGPQPLPGPFRWQGFGEPANPPPPLVLLLLLRRSSGAS